MGDSAWERVRHEVLDGICDLIDARPVLEGLGATKLTMPVLVDLCALVVMSDWIASDTSRFPYERDEDAEFYLSQAEATLDLRAPWAPRQFSDADQAFIAAFPHLGNATPSALQREALAAANATDPGSLMVIEAPTGSGKSEAAFLAAEAMAATTGAGGVFVALPTMATSNAMFGRVLQWLDGWGDSEDPSLWLAHGKAALNDHFAGLVRASKIAQVYDDDATETSGETSKASSGATRVSGWFTGQRRGLLANVVVGTIDQVLLGGLQARHLALRHLALSSKVVIIDEVHATDVYMRSYLQRILTYLGAYGTPVILLSATLPEAQRVELVKAYRQGRQVMTDPAEGGLRRRRRPGSRAGSAVAGDLRKTVDTQHYPVITVAGAETLTIPVEQDQRSRAVCIEPLGDDLAVLVERLRVATAEGGVVGVIRNTVARAQETYAALREVFGDDVELFHSRFVAADRAVRERDLVERLGPRGDRPQRLIVVGTQVLEQSLDLDLDLLVTDLAPVDLLIQRCGRLHRHHRPAADRPESMREAACWLTGVEDWSATPPRAVRGSRYVYAEALLLSSAAVLTPFLDGASMTLPEDVPRLVAAAFDPAAVPPTGWEAAWSAATTKREQKDDARRSKAGDFQVDPPTRNVSLTGWVRTPAREDRDESQGRAQVRDSDDGIEVIVVVRDAVGTMRLPAGDFRGAGWEIPLTPEDRDEVTRRMAGCTVALPQSLTNPRAWDGTIGELESSSVTDTWQGSHWLAGQLALVLDSSPDGSPPSTVLNGHHLTYDPDRGLTVTRPDKDAPV